MLLLRELLDDLGIELAGQALTHASWTERRSESYGRLAFLGDSVLELAISAHLYPLLDPDLHGEGQLTKIRAQTVSGPSCRAVAERLDLPGRMRAGAPEGLTVELGSERVLASVTEAVIGACFLQFGYERTAAAVVEAFTPELENALRNPADFKSALQERLARDGASVAYELVGEEGPPHERTFEVAASAGRHRAVGSGRSKKQAEQEAARELLEQLGA